MTLYFDRCHHQQQIVQNSRNSIIRYIPSHVVKLVERYYTCFLDGVVAMIAGKTLKVYF
jgi:hypothetical protein